MGLLLVDKTADYSANSIGHAGLYTSVTGSLEALHELRRSASKAINNPVPGKSGAGVFGSPVFSAASVQTDPSKGVMFGSKPANGGLTVATIVKVKTGGSTSSTVVGTPATGNGPSTGALWFYNYNQRVAFQAYSYPSGAVPPLSGYDTKSAFQDFLAGSLGAFELFFGVLENGVSLRLYHPKTGTLVTSSATGRDFCFDASPRFQTHPWNGTEQQDQAMFAHWSRVLTPTEMNTFYNEMQTQYSRLNLII